MPNWRSHSGTKTMVATSYDCVVMGAGPAGCTCAALIAEAGLRTLLVERDKMPRFHVGESLMPETHWTLQRLGILNELRELQFIRKNGVQFVNADGKESRPFIFSEHDDRESSLTWHVQRSEFDMLLFNTAMKRGASTSDQTTVLDVELKKQPPHLLTVKLANGKEQQISSKLVVDATGQQSLIASRNNLKRIHPNLKKAAIWGYFENGIVNGGGNPEVTCILHTNSKQVWFWYIPLSNGTVSVGLVGDNDFVLKRGNSPKATFEEELANCPGLQRRLRDANHVGRFHVAKEFSYTTEQAVGPGWLLIGDAYGFIDPIYSSGVYLALKSGELAADSIIDAFYRNDLSPETLGRWTGDFDKGIKWISKLVDVFYTKEFSFGEFIKQHPQHAGNLTDLLIGRVFEGNPGEIFKDMDPWLEHLQSQKAGA